MVVKDNQPTLKTDLETLFARPPGPGQDLRHAQSVNKGHGRLETRRLAVSADLKDYLDWPGFQQALCLDYRSVQTKTGKVLTSRRLAITSLSPQQANPDTLLRLWRSHWSIENNLHYPLDVWFQEDASRLHSGTSALAMALLRKLVINFIRSFSHYPSIKYAREHFAARSSQALDLLELPV